MIPQKMREIIVFSGFKTNVAPIKGLEVFVKLGDLDRIPTKALHGSVTEYCNQCPDRGVCPAKSLVIYDKSNLPERVEYITMYSPETTYYSLPKNFSPDITYPPNCNPVRYTRILITEDIINYLDDLVSK